MKVSDFIEMTTLLEDYCQNSLILKSYDNTGATYKYLIKSSNIAVRKEFFISFVSGQEEVSLLDKIILEYIEIYPAK